jgi:hypothetical protein
MLLMKKEFLKLAYDLAEVMKISHRFNKEKGSAGKLPTFCFPMKLIFILTLDS